jgi:hypothetical protein
MIAFAAWADRDAADPRGLDLRIEPSAALG